MKLLQIINTFALAQPEKTALNDCSGGFDAFCGAFFTGLGDGLGSIIIAFTLSLAAPVGFVLLLPAVWGAEAIWYLYPVMTLAAAILCAGMLKWRYPAWMRHLERNGAS